jgi:acyl dehydratase
MLFARSRHAERLGLPAAYLYAIVKTWPGNAMPTIDPQSLVGREYPPFSVPVEAGRLRLFAKAAGLTDPVYTDEAEARRRGFRSIPAPPTFAYSITMDAGQSFNVLEDLGAPLERAVHGAQRFVFRKPICAGDVITGRQRVAKVYEKKNGELLFIETEIPLVDQDGAPVCDLYSTIIVRRG